ncbi:MAG: hypothetical protein Q7T96_07600 [Methylobacter sp.]|nr:hypothetical protein [Methylobacter sp.]
MRIAPSDALVIKETANAVFCERAAIWLFGSCTDGTLKSRGIDLYVADQKIDIINKTGALRKDRTTKRIKNAWHDGLEK